MCSGFPCEQADLAELPAWCELQLVEEGREDERREGVRMGLSRQGAAQTDAAIIFLFQELFAIHLFGRR
jgi:hypothetical protein